MVPRVSARDGTAGNRPAVGRLVGSGGVAAAALLLGLATPPAQAAGGRLFQLTGPYGCVSDTGAEGCATGRHLHGASSAAVSPDGRNVYVASNTASAVTTFLRQRRDGKVVQPAGLAGCVSEAGRGRCATGRGLFGPFSVAVSADGANVYVASLGAVAAFARNPTTGALTQLPGAAGCLSEGPGDGCAPARGLASSASVAVSPDDKNVYVAAVDSNAVAVFARDSGTGALTQLAGAAGCMSEGGTEGCSSGRGLQGAFSVALSPTGAEVYVSSLHSNAVAVLPRDPSTGSLTQLPGTAGCLSEGGAEGCADARGLANPNGIAVSPDGGGVYVAASGSNALAAFIRRSDGTLIQSGGPNGCVSQGGVEGCARGSALAGAFGIAVSPDARNVYVASLNAVVGFSRNPASGTVRQLSGVAGCTSEGGVAGCSTGRGLAEASSVALDPRGVSAYVTGYQSAALATFARNPKRGRVQVHLRGMPRGCASRPFRARVRVTSLLPLRRVRVHLDGKLVGTSKQGRLIVRIRPRALRPGAHKLRVKAADVTGTRDSRTGRFRRC